MRIPVPRLHGSGQAYVRWQGKTKYFGKYGSSKAEEAYRQWIVNLYGNKSTEAATSPMVIDLLDRYREAHSSQVQHDKWKSIRELGVLAGHRCHEYTPLVFRKHRELIASNGKRCARHVNDLMRLVQRVFRWGVSVEMVTMDNYLRLKTVDPLKPHEVKHQSKKRQPAKREDILRTLQELHPIQAAIIKLVLFTGARPGEICKIRASEVTKTGPSGTWVYRPGEHKTKHHGKRRFIVFGSQGQAILSKYWPAYGDFFFPSSLVVGHYKTASLRQAVGHACKRAGVPHWCPYQLRHLRMTELAVDKGLEMAASVAGHGEESTTKLYQHEPDAVLLRDAM